MMIIEQLKEKSRHPLAPSCYKKNPGNPCALNAGRKGFVLVFVLFLLPCFISVAGSQENGQKRPKRVSEKLDLVQAVICAALDEGKPVNPGIVFSMSIGRISCLTSFDHVSEESVISHNWYHRDRLVTKIKLNVEPPRWSTFSSIKLREGDKGPWRIEITDSDENILETVRFSIVD